MSSECRVDIKDATLTAESPETPQPPPTVTHLCLTKVTVSTAWLQRFTALRSLTVSESTVVTEDSPLALAQVGAGLEKVTLTKTNIKGASALEVANMDTLTELWLSLDEDYAEDFPSVVAIKDCPALVKLSVVVAWVCEVRLSGCLRAVETVECDGGLHGKVDIIDNGLLEKSINLQKRFPPQISLREQDVVECLVDNTVHGGTPMVFIKDWLVSHGRVPAPALELEDTVLKVALFRAVAALCRGSKMFEKGYNKGAAYKLKPGPKKKAAGGGMAALYPSWKASSPTEGAVAADASPNKKRKLK